MDPRLFDALIQIPIILFLILLNGVFAMAELAVMTARKVRLLQRAEDGDKGAKAALELNEKPERFLSTVQVGITLIGTLSSAVAGVGLSNQLAIGLAALFPQIQPYAHQVALVLIVLTITYLSLVLGELVPKRLALTNPERVAARVARPMTVLQRGLYPAVRLLSLSTNLILRLIGVRKPEEPPVTEEEVRSMLQEGEQVGVFEETETDMVESVFRLSDRRVDSLMTPRAEMEWLDLQAPFEENLNHVIDSSHVFFPVAEESLDNVLGIINGKVLLAQPKAQIEQKRQDSLRALIQTALFVPESMPALKVLELLRGASGNLALVIDEYGGVQGMVTLFDVLESIVGAIPEAGQPYEPLATQREDGSWLIDGGMNIEEFKDLLKLPELPEEDRAGYQTVAGFVLSQLGEIPMSGKSFTCLGMRFEVVDMDGLRVDKIMASLEPEGHP